MNILSFYAVRDKRVFSIFVGMVLSLSFARGIRDLPSYPDALTTYSAFILSLISFILVVRMIYIFVKEEKFKKMFEKKLIEK